MPNQHVVVDQNILRCEVQLGQAMDLAKRHGEFVIIPDIALAEMMKNDKWEETTQRSLSLLSANSSAVACAKPIGAMLLEEQQTGLPCANVIGAEQTTWLRALLDELQSGCTAVLAGVQSTIRDAQAQATAQHFDGNRNRAMIQANVAACMNDLSSEELRRARNGDEEFIRGFLAGSSMNKTIYLALLGAGYPPEFARNLAGTPSVSAHVILVNVSTGLRWLNNTTTVRDQVLANDINDGDYVTTATLCRDLVTRERNMLAHYARISEVIRRRAILRSKLGAGIGLSR